MSWWFGRLAPSVLAITMMHSMAIGADSPPIKIIRSEPRPHEVVDGAPAVFFLQLNVPVDHRRSKALLKDSTGIHVLQPRLNSAPQYLFYQPRHLPPGSYELTWLAQVSLGPAIQVKIPFSVK